MKYLAVSWIMFFCGRTTFAQQQYFLYLQTDNNQPFYVRTANQVLSSTGDGYALVGKVADSARTIVIGFPRNAIPEQQFTLPAPHRDAGYVMKMSPDRTWTLVNLQTQAVIRSESQPEEKKNNEVNGEKREDAFSRLLAAAVNDSAVLYNATQAPPVTAPLVAMNTVPATAKPREQIIADNTARSEKPKDEAPAIPKPLTPAKEARAAPDAITASGVKPSMPDSTAHPAKTPAPGPGATPTTPPPATARRSPKKPVPREVSTVKGTITMLPGKQPDRNERKDTIIMLSGTTRTAPEKPAATVSRNDEPKVAVRKPDTARDAAQEVGSAEKTNSNAADTRVARDAALPVKKPDTTALVPGAAAAITADTQSLAPVQRTGPLLHKAAEVLTDTSYIAVFIDESGRKFDTIRISIPYATVPDHAVETRPAPETRRDVPETKVPATRPEAGDSAATTARNDRPLRDNLMNTMLSTIQPVTTVSDSARDTSLPAPPARTSITGTAADSATSATTDAGSRRMMTNSDCHGIATDNDIDKLRIKMLMVSSDEERIGLAKKLFKQKCLLVAQVRALSELYRNDEGRYKWFDAAYPYVSDTGEFPVLAQLLNDEYYRNRFKAMLRN